MDQNISIRFYIFNVNETDMGLKEYKAKRDFKQTKEPEGKVAHPRGGLKFVIQRHNASHLHYDFRLEMEGVMKSWAVPKGPSTDPDVKRLAMMVEDHPMSYRRFEGNIPPGNYGAGSVMVWDEGTYNAPGITNKKESEKQLLRGLHEGAFHFVLHGKKLQGEWMLFKFSKGGENSWLLAKTKDEFASKEDITEQDHSVLTDRTQDEIAEEG